MTSRNPETCTSTPLEVLYVESVNFLGSSHFALEKMCFQHSFWWNSGQCSKIIRRVFSKRASNLEHRTTWITWTTYKFLETHHKLRFFRQLLGLTYWNLGSTCRHGFIQGAWEIFEHRKKWEWGESWWSPKNSSPLLSFWETSFWLDATEEISPKPIGIFVCFPESNLPRITWSFGCGKYTHTYVWNQPRINKHPCLFYLGLEHQKRVIICHYKY